MSRFEITISPISNDTIDIPVKVAQLIKDI